MKRCTVLVDCCANCPHCWMIRYDYEETDGIGAVDRGCGKLDIEFETDFDAEEIHPLCPLEDADAPQAITITTTGE